jgi:hypothetical protein
MAAPVDAYGNTVSSPQSGRENIPYGVDPWQWMKEQARTKYMQGEGLTAGEYTQVPEGVDPDAAFEQWWSGQQENPYFKQRLITGLGMDISDIQRAETYWDFQQRARGLDAGAAEQAALAATQQRMADVLPELQQRALMGGTSAAQWAGRGNYNELANEIAAQTAGDPRAAIQAAGQGGALIANQVAGQQAQEGMAQRAALGGGLMQQAGTEQQRQSDAVRWAAAKEAAARKWAEQSLAAKGLSLQGEVGLDRLRADAEGGVDWRNLSTGLLGGASSLLSTYGAMGSRSPGGDGQGPAPKIPGWDDRGASQPISLSKARPLYR